MKKTLTFLFFTSCFLASHAQTAFTPGNLVVYRYGDGTYKDNTKDYPVLNEQLPAYLDEYTKAGVLVRSIQLPRTTVGDQRALTGIGTATQEGALLRSLNKGFLTVMGYEAPIGNTTVNDFPRVVGRISYTGEVNTATAMPHRKPGVTPVANDIATARSAATVDGTGFWIGATTSTGVRYMPFEFNKGLAIPQMVAPVVIGGAANNFSTSIFNGKLYYSTTNTVNSFNTALPTASATAVTNNIGVNPFQFIMLDTDNNNIPDVMYTAVEVSNTTGESKISKFVLNGNSVWENKGDYYNGSINLHTKFLTVDVEDDTAIIYFTSIGTATAITTPTTVIPSALYKIENKLTEDLSSSISYTLIATAPAKTSFRGVALAPVQPTTTPVKLGPFSGEKLNNGSVKLNWFTYSEKDNSHFEILRSGNSNDISVLSTVQGNGDSDKIINYSFIDASPFDGVNYYQLNQVDYNGKSERSPVVSVNAGINSDLLIAYFKNDDVLELQVDVKEKSNAKILVNDISGQELYSGALQLEKGKNLKSINLSDLTSGIIIITLITDKETKTAKLIKQ